jgi:hypothetical protein
MGGCDAFFFLERQVVAAEINGDCARRTIDFVTGDITSRTRPPDARQREERSISGRGGQVSMVWDAETPTAVELKFGGLGRRLQREEDLASYRLMSDVQEALFTACAVDGDQAEVIDVCSGAVCGADGLPRR